MLLAGENTNAPEIMLNPGLEGIFDVYVGFCVLPGNESAAWLRLDNETPSFLCKAQGVASVKQKTGSIPALEIHEVFWRSADLSQRKICVRPVHVQTVPENAESLGNENSRVLLAYIKCQPVTANQLHERKMRGKEARTVFAHLDTWMLLNEHRVTTEANLHSELEALNHGDFQRVYLECGSGDRAMFLSDDYLQPTDYSFRDPFRRLDRLSVEAWREWKNRGGDPFRVAVSRIHEMGMEVHATWRPGGFKFGFPLDEWNTDGVFDRHPEWRCISKQGVQLARLSFAFEGVQAFIRGFFETLVKSFAVDGICFAFNRRLPVLSYEQPLIDGFEKEHGVDPRTLADDDPEWLKFRAKVLTDFILEVKQAVTLAAGRNIAVSAIVMATEQENLRKAINLRALAETGAVDTLIAYSSIEEDSTSTAHTWTDPAQCDYLKKAVDGTKCRFALNLLPRLIPAETYRQRAEALYAAGVEHLFIWDYQGRFRDNENYRTIRRLGKSSVSTDEGTHCEKQIILELNGWDMGTQCPG